MKTKLLIISLLLGFQYSYAQIKTTGDVIKSTANSFILDQPLDNSTSYEYNASNYINLVMGNITGFDYLPTGNNYFEAKTDPLMVIPPTEGEFGGAPNNDEGGVVGTIPGNFSVSPSGAAIYSIPIDLPPGLSGMTPELGLVYNSQGGYSLISKGWSIQGISNITLAPATNYYDGYSEAITFPQGGKFMLDGKRLIQINENNNQPEFRTELDEISKIVGYDSYNHPPDRFLVKTKSGLKKCFIWIGNK